MIEESECKAHSNDNAIVGSVGLPDEKGTIVLSLASAIAGNYLPPLIVANPNRRARTEKGEIERVWGRAKKNILR